MYCGWSHISQSMIAIHAKTFLKSTENAHKIQSSWPDAERIKRLAENLPDARGSNSPSKRSLSGHAQAFSRTRQAAKQARIAPRAIFWENSGLTPRP